jgi:hypothetical protein
VRKLINDIIQFSDAPENLKSPALADTEMGVAFVITLDQAYDIDCFGIGNTDATQITINGDVISLDANEKDRNGLYLLSSEINTSVLTITHNGTYVGRLAAGLSRFMSASPSREPGFGTTREPRFTASGQTIKGAGGYSFRRLGLDFRYKIDEEIFQDFEDSYESQLSQGFPFFVLFDKEDKKIKWPRLYARTDNQILFQSSINRFLYSKRFEYQEAF